MKYLKILAAAVIAAATLMAFAAAGTASATVLCSSTSNPCTSDYAAGTEIKANLVSGTKWKLATEYQTIECSESSIAGKTSNTGGSTATVKIPLGTFTVKLCKCIVLVLKLGTLEFHWTSFFNWSATWNGLEFTVSCETLFGNVHCIYVTENDNMGPGTGGNPAKMNFNAEIPRLPTNGLCAAEGNLTAAYEVTNPNPLFAAPS